MHGIFLHLCRPLGPLFCQGSVPTRVCTWLNQIFKVAKFILPGAGHVADMLDVLGVHTVVCTFLNLMRQTGYCTERTRGPQLETDAIC